MSLASTGKTVFVVDVLPLIASLPCQEPYTDSAISAHFSMKITSLRIFVPQYRSNVQCQSFFAQSNVDPGRAVSYRRPMTADALSAAELGGELFDLRMSDEGRPLLARVRSFVDEV